MTGTLTEIDGCTCGAPEACEYHEVTYYHEGQWGNQWPFGIKDDYNQVHDLYIDGPDYHAVKETFEVGDRVIVAWFGDDYISSYASTIYHAWLKNDHAGMAGTVVDVRGEKCYGIKFDDGHVSGYYANELEPAVPKSEDVLS